MKKVSFALLFISVLLITGCSHRETLDEARANFRTNLTDKWKEDYPVDIPPAGVLETVEYESPVGKLSAYVSPDPGDSQKHPAIIWIFGGFGNSVDETAWAKAEPNNDQSASVFRKNGIVTMYPSFRGGNYNPGYQEYFLGEVDDVISAAEYLASLPYVDPDRIYLGGHSTGGTLALLTAECSKDLFRAVFAFGAIDRIDSYGVELPFNSSNEDEITVRSPIFWLDSIKTKTFVIEGNLGNIRALNAMNKANKNSNISFCPVRGYDHFDILKPGCDIVAAKILSDTGKVCEINLSASEIG